VGHSAHGSYPVVKRDPLVTGLSEARPEFSRVAGSDRPMFSRLFPRSTAPVQAVAARKGRLATPRASTPRTWAVQKGILPEQPDTLSIGA